MQLNHDDLVELPDGECIGTASVFVYHSKEDKTKLHYVLYFEEPDKEFICTDRGWRFTGNCWHIDDAKELV